MNKQEYIRVLTEQIRCSKAREPVAIEIEAHIKDQAEAYMEYGVSQEEAEFRAVREMGDPVEAGVELDHIHRPHLEWKLALLILGLSILGLFVQFGIGNAQNNLVSFPVQCMYVLAGLGLMTAVYFFDYSFIGRYGRVLYFVYLVCLAAASSYLPYINGAKQALRMPIYLFAPIMAGVIYTYRGTGPSGILKCMAYMLLPVVFAIKSVPSLQTGCSLAFIFFLMLFAAIKQGWFRVKINKALGIMAGIGILLPAGFLILGYQFVFSSYQRARLDIYLNPASAHNYVSSTVKDIVECSRIWGAGGSVEAWKGMFPGDFRMEYIFTYLLYQYGILLGVLVVCLLLLLTVKAFGISFRQKNQLALMLGFGCGLVFFTESFGCIMMNLGLGLFTTHALPFFSYSKEVIAVYYILAGLLLGIYRYKDINKDHPPAPVRRVFWKAHPDS